MQKGYLSSASTEARNVAGSRIGAAIEPLLRESQVRTIAVVTHRGVIQYALTKFFGFSEKEAWARTAPYGAVVVAACAPFCMPREATR